MTHYDHALLILIATQALTISIAASYRWTSSQLHLFRNYSFHEYSKFYVFSKHSEYLLILIRIFLDALTFILTFLLFYFWEDRDLSLSIKWGIFTALQLLPSMFSLAVINLSNYLRSDVKKPPAKKVITIIPRSIFDYISLPHIFLLSVGFILSISIILSNQKLSYFQKLSLLTLFLITVSILLKNTYEFIYGKKNDKLMSEEDQLEKRRFDIQRSIIGISLSFALFSFIGLSNSEVSYWQVCALSSFVQISVLYGSKRWIPQNMHVYR